MSTDATGVVIAGKYQIRRLLGRGGMGSVYEGVHVEIGKRVAIKIIDPLHAGSGEIAARFRREARAASAVESDCIVQVFDVGQDPEVGLYLVMEYLTGEDLSVRLEREQKLDPQLALAVGIQAARALAKAHAAGVVHRDLKPANLFLCATDDGSLRLKILDFGISKLTRPEGDPLGVDTTARPLTRYGAVIGTPQYMSPEQAQGLPVDARTDVWSLGAVLYEALAGRGPFAEMPTYEQTIIQIVTGRPKPLAEVAPWVPPAVAEIVHAALQHDPATRLPDCATFARRLADCGARGSVPCIVLSAPGGATHHDQLSSTLAAPAHSSPGTHAGLTVSTARPRARAALALALAMGVLVAASVALIFALRRPASHASAAAASPSVAVSVATAPSVTMSATAEPIVAPVVDAAPTEAASAKSPSPPRSPTRASAGSKPAPKDTQYGGLGTISDQY